MNWNPTIITIVIATAAFILTLMAAAWRDHRATTRQTDDLRLFINDKLDAQTKLIDAKLETVKVELQNLTARMERVEKQIDSLTIKPIFSKTGD